MKGWFEYYREVCPICNKSGGCMINDKGDTVVCIREESNIVFSTGLHSWVHRLKEKKKVHPVTSGVVTHPKAPAEILDMFYRILLQRTELNTPHIDHLTGAKRAMNSNEVTIRGYRSFPEKPWETVKRMLPNGSEKFPPGIPGFYRNEFGWSINGFQGILIPYRNHYNQIVGFQMRVDNPKNDVEINKGSIEYLNARVISQPNQVQIFLNGEMIVDKQMEIGEVETIQEGDHTGTVKLVKGQRYFWLSSSNRNDGTGAGSPLPVHVAVSTNMLKEWEDESNKHQKYILHRANSVWITEGGLKADISAEHIEKVYSAEELSVIGSTVLAIPGVNTWRIAPSILEEMGVQRVNIAFDMDVMSNEKVQYQLKEFIVELKNQGYEVYLAIWNEHDGKGLDDVFINRRLPNLRKM